MENIRSSNYRVIKEEGYREELAARVRASLDMEKVYGIAGLWPATGWQTEHEEHRMKELISRG